jgi:hypothetical protein
MNVPYILPPSEETKSECRPVIILAHNGTDIIAGMITTQDYTDRGAIKITPEDYLMGGTTKIHFFRPERLHCDHVEWLEEHIGRVRNPKLQECFGALHKLFS